MSVCDVVDEMVGLGRFELPTHGLGIRFRLLMSKQVNNLTRQIRNKFGKIRNTRATTINPSLMIPTQGIRREARNDSEPSIHFSGPAT